MNAPVSYLFVPGNRPERFNKALSSGADVVIIDLEDAVPDADKSYARDETRHWLEWHGAQRSGMPESGRIIVRINAAGSAHIDDDLALLRNAPPAGVMLAKAESAMQIERVANGIDPEGKKLPFIIPLVESALGVLERQSRVGSFFSSPLVVGGTVYIGAADGRVYALE